MSYVEEAKVGVAATELPPRQSWTLSSNLTANMTLLLSLVRVVIPQGCES